MKKPSRNTGKPLKVKKKRKQKREYNLGNAWKATLCKVQVLATVKWTVVCVYTEETEWLIEHRQHVKSRNIEQRAEVNPQTNTILQIKVEQPKKEPEMGEFSVLSHY